MIRSRKTESDSRAAEQRNKKFDVSLSDLPVAQLCYLLVMHDPFNHLSVDDFLSEVREKFGSC